MGFCSLFSYNLELSSKTNVTVPDMNLSLNANAMQAVVERKNKIIPLPNYKEMTIVAFHKSVKIRIPSKRCPGAHMGVGVLSHVSNSQKRELIRKTWARNSCVFFLVAVPLFNKTHPSVLQETIKFGDLLVIEKREIYGGVNSSLPLKVAAWFNFVYKYLPEVTLVLKTDDDSYVKIPETQQEVEKSSTAYWGRISPYTKPNRNLKAKEFMSSEMFPGVHLPPYCSGAGYALKKNAMRCFVNTAPHVDFLSCEDVQIGLVMQKCKILPTMSCRVLSQGLSQQHDTKSCGRDTLYQSQHWVITHYADISKIHNSLQTDIIAQKQQKVPLQIVDKKTIDTAIVHNGTLIPKVLHFVWISTNWNQTQPEIPTKVRHRINLWNNTHTDWSVVIWTNVLVERHFPELYMTLKRIKTESWVSNLIRYHVIARYGGIYIDTDIIPLRVLPSKLLENAFTVCEKPRDGTRCKLACNAVIGSPRGNPEMKLVASQALRRTEIHLNKSPQNSHKKNYKLAVTGPPFWSTFTTRSNSSIKILPSTTFYPCDWTDTSACKKEKYTGNPNVYAMHLWEHSWW